MLSSRLLLAIVPVLVVGAALLNDSEPPPRQQVGDSNQVTEQLLPIKPSHLRICAERRYMMRPLFELLSGDSMVQP